MIPPGNPNQNNKRDNNEKEFGNFPLGWLSAILRKFDQSNQENIKKKMMDQPEQDLDRKTIVLSLLCSIFLCPIAFHVTNRKAGSFESDILAGVLVITVSAILVYVINNVVKQQQQNNQNNRCQTKSDESKEKDRPKFNGSSKTIFNVFNPQEFREKFKSNQNKIDPKYFNARYIIQELMEMWGTTYSVITWSSFYIVGGTVGAGERLAQKIKTKYATRTEQQQQQRSASYRMGSSLFNTTGTSDTDGDKCRSRQAKSSLRRVSSWTRKSFDSTRRKLSRMMGRGGEPLLSIDELGANLNTSLS